MLVNTTHTHMKKQNANEWLELLAAEIGGKPEKVPAGWLTISQIQQQLEMTIGQTECFVRRAENEGKLQKKKFRIVTAAGTRDVWHFNSKK
jgi:hypothetical protein